MIRYELGVEDLADTRFGISPVAETVFSLWALSDPGRYGLHLPWLRAVRESADPVDPRLLALVGPSFALPDFLTPRPGSFAPSLEEELDIVRRTPADIVRRDIAATHAPEPVPAPLRDAAARADAPVHALVEALCDLLLRHWHRWLEPAWPRMRLVLEADTTYRARQLATGGARRLFSDLHPNVSWADGVLRIDQMIGRHRVAASGRGLLLVPSIFAYKPVPPMSADDPPSLAYPARGLGTLWMPAEPRGAPALRALLGAPRTGLLQLLAEPLPTIELARRLDVSPSAVSQHLRVLHAAGLVIRVRDGRYVLYRRSTLGDGLWAGTDRDRASGSVASSATSPQTAGQPRRR